ncbi:hypothetical protein DYB32_009495 [Aphanomyces invadans]|uniref:Helicase-associated domain-containing protein n=1 Tax=Aphanomyces invadans TaxID=157072 RepID=A0A3R7A2V2_9STRA|nr:hypothetical protein DYB32_009495 [Aphanomyces invadans]
MTTASTPLQSKKPLYTLEKQKQLLEVVRAFHEEAGQPPTISIKQRFRIPFSDKYPVEMRGILFPVTQLRKEKREGRLDTKVEAELDAIGFVWDPKQHKWKQNQLALSTYKKIYGNLLVQQTYKVPTNDPLWPRELWAMKLNDVVSNLRQTKATLSPDKKRWLDDLGFVWDAPACHWNANLSALKMYKDIHGHVSVPTQFVVPHDDPRWPKGMWGLQLGSVVSWLRTSVNSMPPEKRDALNAMGFVWRLQQYGVSASSPPLFTVQKQRQILEIVECQRTQQPHTKFVTLPGQFKVPSDAPWPSHLHKCVVDISGFRRAYDAGRLQPSIVQALDAMNFVWNDQKHRWNLNVEALAIYKATHHDLLMNADFIVPHDDPKWPIYLWGKNLGMVVCTLRCSKSKLSQDQRDELDAMGFVWDALEDHWQANFVGLETYKRLHGDLNVPADFVVPDNDPLWPRQLWNTRFGSFVHTLRHRNAELSNERRDALETLGFVWSARDLRWKRNMLALETFKNLYGHLRIRNTFVVPDQDPNWPPELWKMKLGYRVHSLRVCSRQDGYPASRLDQLAQVGLIKKQ